ncbi:zinc finger, C3HC4 type (RING finger) domain-containing protein [Toxoplasma gondii ME49]|uniref:Zinc finger (C3HC4 type RING finger) protein,putative n=3 Tax=Toxoplasma gondii TaxID=5811 RepID=B6KBA9_TOXGV|nr:zinc finger, C3HC4 type (RING finger) domain-containing protein [Toxoplasma gondii ME49]EPT29378.1 zinc finger, C3HC4 type (RING finger) domain-containing protein [Toxoplasma gondii ME49]ESS32232.1 zinc finger, C3HC4 type (RING finger) domain-containing protein [Toxoplasma gondii VEG]KYF41691.1 zinc finger, C3HC4 type (RING finger) domain-containing protein [Toxoplasma gondii ARI]CEL74448.1 TPA: zinc finger (C3HC4 type RING finger) protein,putative [Toxoplasma gondii VEG]|eukprot:XP_002365093.1 zinc finger, C3HC4 type (RING finger) domain-containing protein [Toxoplasma gondii ME49]
MASSHGHASAGSSLAAAASEDEREQPSPGSALAEHAPAQEPVGQAAGCRESRDTSSSSAGCTDTSRSAGASIPVPVRRTYLDEVPEDLKCPICFDSAVSCRTPCAHFFCYACINSHINNRLRQQQAVNCPLCRTAVSATNLMSIGGDKVARVRALRVVCVGAVSGCGVSGTLEQVEAHENVCPHVLVFCSFRDRGCIAPLIRREAPVHEKRCRFNPLVRACRHNLSGCKVRGTEELLLLHEHRCRYRNMEKFVRCPHFESAGCGLLIKKKYRERHADCCAFKLVKDVENLSPRSPAAAEAEADSVRRLAKRRRAPVRNTEGEREEGEEEREGQEERQVSVVAEGERKKLRVEAEPQARQGAGSGGGTDAEDDGSRKEESALSELHSFRISFEWRNQEKAISYEDLREQLRPYLPNVASVEAGRTFGEFHAIVENVPVTMLRAVGMAADPQISCSLFDLNLRLKGITTVQEGIW